MCIVGAAQLYRPNLLSQLLGVMFPFSSGIRDEREANFSLPYLLRYCYLPINYYHLIGELEKRHLRGFF